MVKNRYSRLRSKRDSTITIVLALLLMLTLLLLLMMNLGIISMNNLDSSPNELGFFSGDGLGERGEQWVQVLSSSEPRAFLYHNFLSKEECEYIIAQATPHMRKSTVVDNKTGRSIDSRYRTSTGMFLQRGQDRVVKAIERRIAEFTFIPVAWRADPSSPLSSWTRIPPHSDYFDNEFSIKDGGQRIATLLMYLSDVDEGGETVFPAARGNISSVPWWDELSECGRRGLAVKPKMGNALLFWSLHPDTTADRSSIHGSCPVIEGNKWSATKWMRVHNYEV